MNPPQPNKLSPAIQRLYRAADEAWGRQDYEKSISLMEEATRKEPYNPSLLLSLARACGRRYDFPAAKRYIEKAVQISKDPARTLGEAGQICVEFDNVEMALDCLQRATLKQGVQIAALVLLAEIYIHHRRIDEAAELVTRMTKMDPKNPVMLVEEAVVRRSQGNTSGAESLFREVLTIPASSASVRVRAFYQLAAILDNEGRYDEAMDMLLEAKALLRPNAGPSAATLQRMQSVAREMEQTITATVMDRWRADADKLQPLRRIAVLCGHPRSGTTLLEQVLDAHSDVTSAEETHIMHQDAYLPLIRDFPDRTSILQALDLVPPNAIRQARDNYFRCMELFLRQKIDSRLLVDKNPALNLMIPMVVRIFPETKFLIALRDPRDVMVSCFIQNLPLTTPVGAAYLSLEGTVNQYANVMGFLLEMLPRVGNQWMYVRYEEMVEDLPTVAKSALALLGLDFEDNVLKFYEHARAKPVKSRSQEDVQKPLYRKAVGRWRNYQKYLEPYLPALERFVKAFNYDKS